MLILTRKVDEEVIVDNSITVKVVSIKDKVVELLITSKYTFFIDGVELFIWGGGYKVEDVIVINKDIKIMICKVTGQKRVCLGFDAPKHIKISRKELQNGQVMA